MTCDIFIFLPFMAKIICLSLSYDGNTWNIVLFPPHHVAADAGGSGSLIASKNCGGDLLLCIKFCSCLT